MNSIINILEFGLDGSYARHKALSNNIANVSTPNYKREDVNFIDVLNDNIGKLKKNNSGSSTSLKSTNPNHISASNNTSNRIRFKATNHTNTTYRNDQNNVDIDSEMAKLSKNNLYYNTLTQRISGKFGMLQEVIQKGSE
ncbi:MAG: flagellar basal body rod protein FlgB [Bacillota bacterium]